MHVTVKLSTLAVALGALTIVAIVVPAAPARAQSTSPAIRQLEENAEYWRRRKRPEKVAGVWRKILRSDPTHVRALVELTTYEAKRGKKKQAGVYLARLQKVRPAHPDIPRLRRLVDMGGKYKVMLAQARALVESKKLAEGIAKYREAFGKHAPGGLVGIEFYTTLGGTKDGWEEARAGLERLARENPGNAEFELHYAKHLTYREKTRRDGIDRLRKLAAGTTAKKGAVKAWRKALEWLHGTAADVQRFEAYLAEVGEDAEIRKLLEKLKASTPKRVPASPGDRALAKGELDRAEDLYRQELAKKKRSIRAHLGLARVAMEKKDYDEALRQLAQVKVLAPKRPRLWKRFTESARFWRQMREAERLRAEGQLRRALAALEKARRLSPREGHHADAMVADIYVVQGKRKAARQKYRAVLDKDKDHAGALRGLIELLVAEERYDEAAELNERLARIDAKVALEASRMKSIELRTRAAFARKRGEHAEAQAFLEEARREVPDDKWVLHDLVDLHLELGDRATARNLLEPLLAREPRMVEAQILRARLLTAEGRLGEAQRCLDALPKDHTHASLTAVRRQIRVRALARRLARRTRDGADREARRELERLEREVQDSPQLTAYIALAWSEVGEHGRALRTIRRVEDRTVGRKTAVRLQRAAILLRAGRLGDLGRLLAEMETKGDWRGTDRKNYDALRVAMTVRRVDRARERGDLRRGFFILQPLLEEFPENPKLLAALGRLFTAKNDHEEALAVFLRLLDLDERNYEAREGAVLAARAAGQDDEARRLLTAGKELAEQSPEMDLVEARYALARGDDAAALDALEHARIILESGQEPPLPEDEETLPLDRDSDYDDVLKVAYARFSGLDEPTAGRRQRTTSLLGQVETEQRDIRARYSGDLAGALGLRYRSGVEGLGRLLDLEIPLSVSLPTGFVGRLRFTVRAVVLNAGDLDVLDPEKGERFGRIGTVHLTSRNSSLGQAHEGAALEASWAYRGLLLHVGTSPLGFPLQTVVGGARWSDSFGGFGIGIRAGRRVVTDSLLSYAGAFEPVTGSAWGQVTANGGRLDLSFQHDAMLYYLFGGYDQLLGTDVKSNGKGFGGAGLRWRVSGRGATAVSTGFSLGFMAHDYNLRHFTFGHGGYFSPQSFVNGAVPLVVRGRYDRVHVDVDADLGVNWFREDDVDYYPTEAALQAARAARRDEDGEGLEAVHEGQEQFGIAANLRARVAYEFLPQFTAGVDVRAHYAADYTELYGGIFFGYSFRTGSQPSLPVIPDLSW